MDGNGILICRFGSRRKKKKRIHPRCSVVAVFKMLIRILNTLPSRIWDVLFFLFSGYSKSTVWCEGGFSRWLWLFGKLIRFLFNFYCYCCFLSASICCHRCNFYFFAFSCFFCVYYTFGIYCCIFCV